MASTERKILQWGLTDQCKLLEAKAVIKDVEDKTHLTSPPKPGFYLVTGTPSSEQTALKESAKTRKSVCAGGSSDLRSKYVNSFRVCPCIKECNPEVAAVRNGDNSWQPAIRPKSQRP